MGSLTNVQLSLATFGSSKSSPDPNGQLICDNVQRLLFLTIINMENDNSQSPKDPKKNIFSTVVKPIRSLFNNPKHPVSPVPSKKKPRTLFEDCEAESL